MIGLAQKIHITIKNSTRNPKLFHISIVARFHDRQHLDLHLYVVIAAKVVRDEGRDVEDLPAILHAPSASVVLYSAKMVHPSIHRLLNQSRVLS